VVADVIPFGSDILKNPVFLSAVCSLLLAQFLKALINVMRRRSRSLRELALTFLWRTGGMPSSHSSLAVSIATSNIFILALFFALVVMRDAMGVRRSAGQQARVLNLMGKELSSRLGLPQHTVKEVYGHSASEVLVGSVLGFFIALAFCTL
jgi:acid phosphatase family membrane protein YuiD